MPESASARPRVQTVDSSPGRVRGGRISPAHTEAPDRLEELRRLIVARTATVGVVGQGYVGFGLAQRAAEVGFRTHGVDIDAAAVLRCAKDNRIASGYQVTTDASVLAKCDVILIAVPTPTRIDDGMRRSDLSLVIAATEAIARVIAVDDRPRLILSESTYASGTTREVVMPILRRVAGADCLAVGYSPERIDPGNRLFDLAEIPKVVSGADQRAADLALAFYRQIVTEVVPASSMEAAEATKLLENTFRFVNIAFAHEFDEYCHELGLSSHEITKLAATKPFGYLPFYAGAGVGGHCIAEDPYFLYDSMRQNAVRAPLIETAMTNHDERASVIVRRISDRSRTALAEGARILVLGVTYKPNISDTRRSPAQPIIAMLESAGAHVDYYDPYVPEFAGRSSVDLPSCDPNDYDLAVVLAEHSVFKTATMASAGWRVLQMSGDVIVPRRVEARA